MPVFSETSIPVGDASDCSSLNQPFTVLIDGKVPKELNLGLVTKVEATQQVIAQFQNTLGNRVYATPFGDKPSPVRVQFVMPLSNCGIVRNAEEFAEDYSVQDDVLSYYAQNRFSPDNSNPSTIVIGGIALTGVITAMNLTASNEQTPIASGVLEFTAWL